MTNTHTVDLGNGFRDHGVATPMSNHRGTVATVDGNGRNVVLVWLFDHRGGYALLVIDVETGKADEIPAPFTTGDCPFASILSTRNRYYTHFGNWFCEFDPSKRAFTFYQETVPQMAMSMTEDDAGRIWSITYPQSGVAMYDPADGTFRDYGHVYTQDWPQYQRSCAADTSGHIYFAVGNTLAQIIALDPETGVGAPLIDEADRVQGSGTVFRDVNGKVFGRTFIEGREWVELFEGKATPLGGKPEIDPAPIITGSQGLFHTDFPDGTKLETCDLIERQLVVTKPDGSKHEVAFDYTSDGAHLMGLAAAPDGTICGGTAFPMRFFSYDPREDSWTNRPCFGQANTVVTQGDRFFVGGYIWGFLLEWDPASPWVDTLAEDKPGYEKCNPVLHYKCQPTINRPHALLAHPDGKTIVLAGTPDYGYTGGGLLFWDRETKSGTLLTHEDILPHHSTTGLAALEGGKLLGGSTTAAGTGGARKADVAELYVMDMATKHVEWHAALIDGANEYAALAMVPSGLVYGLVDNKRFVVFDPASRTIVHQQDTAGCGYQQGPRRFITTPDGDTYLLLLNTIEKIDPESFALETVATPPVPVNGGGDYHDGRIWFASGSHLISYSPEG